MKRRNVAKIRTVVVFVIVGLCVSTAVALTGSGTEEDPWRIQSLTDFDEFAVDANYWDGYARLETDVNLAGQIYTTAVIAPDTNNSNYDFDGTAFTGVFDGNDKRIINLTIDEVSTDYLGLFGDINDGEVKNLGVEGGFISGEYCVGGLVGLIESGSISNCYSTGEVKGIGCVGGLVGYNFGGSFSNCYFTGDVRGGWDVGGLLGSNSSNVSNCHSTGEVSGLGDVGGLVGWNGGSISNISNCYSTGDVSGTAWAVGGLVGSNQSGSVSNCHSTGEVSGFEEVGGLMGWNDLGSVLNCYSTGDVIGTEYIGGLLGNNDVGSVLNCYSTGDVSNNEDAGGLIGVNHEGTITNCFWDTDTQTHGVTESIGLNQGTVTNVEGLPTAEMQERNTFTSASWDFVEVWLINEGATYPVLRQENRSDLNGDGGVDMLDFAIFADHWLEGVE